MVTKVMDMRLNELLLLELLEQKKIPEATKTMVRNIMAPAIEAIEDCRSPQEVMDTIEMLIRMIVPVIVMGLEASVLPDKIEHVYELTASSFLKDLHDHRNMYLAAKKASKQGEEI